MKAAILTLALLLAARGVAVARTLPVPPIPPAKGPTMDAPVPNMDARVPYEEQRRSPVTLDMGIHRRSDMDPSLGFSPGARYRAENDRRLLAVPGVLFRVPLP